MAKRKRLELPEKTEMLPLETKSGYSGLSRMPIAEVASDTATRAALDEVTQAMATAEVEGRIVRKIPIAQIDLNHLNRDRMVLDAQEMEVLKTSLSTRGQQTPIEVLTLPAGRFGLISGLRRLVALQDLGEAAVLAFLRKPQSAGASYIAMIEENEVRAALSFYERANIAVQAVEAGVYRTPQEAVKVLFASVPSAKRSKILRFVVLRQSIGASLSFPAAIPEKLGLALATALTADKAVAIRIKDALRKTPAPDAIAERRMLERALRAHKDVPVQQREGIAPGITLTAAQGRVTLSGKGVDEALTDALRQWLANR